jgi:hypothetical protein
LAELVSVHAHGDERNAEVVIGHVDWEFVGEREPQPPSERGARSEKFAITFAAIVGPRACAVRGKISNPGFTGASVFAI